MIASPVVSEPRLRYEIDLTDRELGTAWVREAHARRGLVGRLLGPLAIALGAVGLATRADPTGRLVAVLALAYGLFHLARPFLAARRIVSERRRRGGSTTVIVSIDARGITVSREGKSLTFPWKEITAAGKREDYVWYEVRGAHRAPVPTRVIPDLPALERELRARTKWID